MNTCFAKINKDNLLSFFYPILTWKNDKRMLILTTKFLSPQKKRIHLQ